MPEGHTSARPRSDPAKVVLVERWRMDGVGDDHHSLNLLALDEMDLEGFHRIAGVSGVEPVRPIPIAQENQYRLGAGTTGSRDHGDVTVAAGSGSLSRGLFRIHDPSIPEPVPATIEHLSGEAVEQITKALIPCGGYVRWASVIVTLSPQQIPFSL